MGAIQSLVADDRESSSAPYFPLFEDMCGGDVAGLCDDAAPAAGDETQAKAAASPVTLSGTDENTCTVPDDNDTVPHDPVISNIVDSDADQGLENSEELDDYSMDNVVRDASRPAAYNNAASKEQTTVLQKVLDSKDRDDTPLNDTLATVDIADVSSSSDEEELGSGTGEAFAIGIGDTNSKQPVKLTTPVDSHDVKPFCTRRKWLFVIIGVASVAAIAALSCTVVFGSKKANKAAAASSSGRDGQYDSDDGGGTSSHSGPGIRKTWPPTSVQNAVPTALPIPAPTSLPTTRVDEMVTSEVAATSPPTASNTSGVSPDATPNATTQEETGGVQGNDLPVDPTSIPTTAITVDVSPTLSPTFSVKTDEPTFTGIEPTDAPTNTIIENKDDDDTSNLPQYDTFSFYVMGDAPYTTAEEDLVREQLSDISKEVSSDDMFLFHVGDMMRAKTTFCRRRRYQFIEDAFTQELPNLPTFLIPGDNDWNDCPDPDLAWQYWEEYFLSFERNFLGVRSFLPSVERQPNRQENLAFVLNGVLMIGLNQVAGIDDVGYEKRLNHNKEWIDEQVDRYESDMNNGSIRLCIIFAHSGKGVRVFRHIAERLSGFPFPTIVFKGDGHNFSASNTIKGVGWDLFKSVQVDQGGKAPPIKVSIQGTTKQALKNPITGKKDGEGVKVFWDLVRVDRRGGLYSNYVEEDFADE